MDTFFSRGKKLNKRGTEDGWMKWSLVGSTFRRLSWLPKINAKTAKITGKSTKTGVGRIGPRSVHASFSQREKNPNFFHTTSFVNFFMRTFQLNKEQKR